MKKLVIAAAFIAASFLVPVASVFADSPGQLSNGATNYEVKNVTKNGSYGQTASATCGETVKYSVLLANSDFGLLKDLTVKADLGTGAISASAINATGATTSVSGKVTVSLDKGSLVYVPGSTVRVSSDGATKTPLADGVTAGGVNAGELNGSTQTFVQFQAKVDCPTTPPPVKIQVCELATKNVITINESDYDASKHSKNLADCAAPVQIKVCELSTKNIITINEKDFDAKKHTKDLNKCAEAPVGSIKVCVIASKEIVTIKDNEFDASKHTKNLNDCAEVATPVAPAELPKTGSGVADAIGKFVGVLSLTSAVAYYVTSRRNG